MSGTTSRPDQPLALFERFAEAFPDFVFVIDLRERKDVYINSHVERVLGFTPQQIIDMGPGLFERLMHPDELADVMGELDRLAAAADDESVADIVHRVRHANGEWRWLHSRAVVFERDAEGLPLSCIGSSRDVTRERRTSEALRHSELLNRRIVEAMPGGVIEVDSAGVVRYANAAAIRFIGRDASQVLGSNILEFRGHTYWEDGSPAEQEDRPAVRCLRTGEPQPPVTIGVRRDDGELAWAIWSAVPRLDPETGQAQGTIVTFLDISEQRRAELALQQAQKLESLGVLAGGIAHDFNNLLTPVLGNAELALYELELDSPARERLEAIQKATVRASELTRQMLAYAGRVSSEVCPLDLNDVVEDIGSLLGAALSKLADVRYELDPDLPALLGDAVQLRQVVMNLMTNASDALEERSGQILLRTSVVEPDGDYWARHGFDERLPAGRYVEMLVADDGCGMDEATRRRIFDPFFSTKFDGRGLGLAAVRGIVRSHSGALGIRSAPGEGTEARMLIPVAGSERPADQPGDQRLPDWRGHGRILVADDEAAIRSSLEAALRHWGFEVELAADGDLALELFSREPESYRLVLLDMTMPRMTGLELLERLRAASPEVPVVLMSGHAPADAERRFASGQLQGFLNKPFMLSALHACLQRVLAD